MDARELIAAKRKGRAHSREELAWLARSIADETLSDVRLAAWIMAAAIQGLTDDETHALTVAMRDAGPTLRMPASVRPRADKHSTGGVGDKVSLAAVPLVAACGVPVLKLTGRALGFTGGTADKLEALPGVRTVLSLDEAWRQVEAVGAAFVVQAADWAPADKRMYAMRDEIGAIDSIPLIAASIMSKKLAAGADALVLDVKVGSGTFMTSLESARRLAQLMLSIGRAEGMRAEAFVTDMDAPLGRSIGTGLELTEAWELLLDADRADGRLRELVIGVATAMVAGALAVEQHDAMQRVVRALTNGDGAARLARILAAQGGLPELGGVPRTSAESAVLAESDGYLVRIEPRPLGQIARELCTEHPGAGILLNARIGESVQRGAILARVKAVSESEAVKAARAVARAFLIAPEAPTLRPIILERLRA